MIISMIVAASDNGVIGKNNTLPWRMPGDMKFFKDKTTGHVVVTGRKNYESIPEKFRPLPGRQNIVVTTNTNYLAPGAIVMNAPEKAIAWAKENNESECFIIGGAQLYRYCMPLVNRIYLTRIHTTLDGDAFFETPDEKNWKLIHSEKHSSDDKNAFEYTFLTYEKK